MMDSREVACCGYLVGSSEDAPCPLKDPVRMGAMLTLLVEDLIKFQGCERRRGHRLELERLSNKSISVNIYGFNLVTKNKIIWSLDNFFFGKLCYSTFNVLIMLPFRPFRSLNLFLSMSSLVVLYIYLLPTTTFFTIFPPQFGLPHLIT